MIGALYRNSLLYYKMMKSFLRGEISASKFRKLYCKQRNKDLDEDDVSGYSDQYSQMIDSLVGNQKRFRKEYLNVLYEQGSKFLATYEQGANELNIKGEWFFIGLHSYIDCYVLDYHSSKDEGFDPVFNVDEETLRARIQQAFDVLERNKERWM